MVLTVAVLTSALIVSVGGAIDVIAHMYAGMQGEAGAALDNQQKKH